MKKLVLICMAVLTILLAACGATSPKHTISYLGGEVKTITMFEQEWPLACIYTEYTNASGESALPADWVNVKAYQNGTEIPIIVFTGEKIDEYIQCDTSVQDGVTAKVIWTFQIENNSPVSIELSNGEKYNIEG